MSKDSQLVFLGGGFKTFTPPQSEESKRDGTFTVYHNKRKLIVMLKMTKVVGSEKPVPTVAIAESV